MTPRTARIGSQVLAAALLSAGSIQTGWADRYSRHHKPGHGYHHYPHAPRHYRLRDSDDSEKLVYGLLVGGLFGYVIANSRNSESYPPPASYRRPAYPPVQGRYGPVPPLESCLQEREYQMTVIVGGKEAQAYGTACLQPDGSWYRGPAQVVAR